jgi:effector-binding domain-containing protein
MLALADSGSAQPGARWFEETIMMTPWRAVAIAGVLTLGLTSFALAQAADPAQAAPEPQAQTSPPPPPEAKPAEPKPAESKPAESKPSDPFGEQVTLTPKTIIFLKGNSTWDKALENLQDAFKSVYALLDKQGIAKAGPAMTIYTQADDTGFQFQAAVPIAEAPKDLPKGDIEVGQSPAGQALKFTHRGSYDSMDGTYEAITDYLDEKRLEAGDSFIEEYQTDPVTTPDDKFVITVYVPVK